MRTIIAGSRDLGLLHVRAAMEACPWSNQISVVLSGGARGVDRYGAVWAHEHGIPVEEYLPDWERFGRSAGIRRNVEMATLAEALVAIWDLVSPGTEHMITYAEKQHRRVFVWSPALGEVRRTERGWLPLASGASSGPPEGA